MNLVELKNFFNLNTKLKIYKNKYFKNIVTNSNFANKNKVLFIENKNFKRKYLLDSIKKKIPAIISFKKFKNIEIPQFIIKNNSVYKEEILKKIFPVLPTNKIAITGTNGKSSVVWYISSILSHCNIENKSLGTLGYRKNLKKISNLSLTTPLIEDFYEFSSLKKKSNCVLAFEASSHALHQNRLSNIKVNVAALTNISLDHIDYHKNITNYKNAKIKLFTKHLTKNGVAIINAKIKNISRLINYLKKNNIKTIYYGKKDIYFIKKNKNLYLNIYKKKYLINKNFQLVSKIELENLECAIACCKQIGLKDSKVLKAILLIKNPPGRFQKIKYKKSLIVIDYAHTPDALKKILLSFTINNKKPSVIFGCGGNRDTKKREEMGILANKYAKNVYITDDNPRNENPSKIRKKILKYCPRGIEISDRKKAISIGIKNLQDKEILIIAGKGHEKFQIIKNKKFKFDDYQIVKQLIN